MLIFYWFLYYFREIDVFEVDNHPRAFWEATMWKNDLNLGVKNGAKTLKIGIINKTPNEIKNFGYCFPVFSCILLAQIINSTTKAMDPSKE